MISNEHHQRYDDVAEMHANETDFDDMELDHDYEILPNIAAENAALKIKVKQECDIAYVTRNNISKADVCVDSLKRDNDHCNDLIDIKTQELAKLEDDLTNLCISREHIRSNAENAKRQYELIMIEDEQRNKEQDLICSNYQAMINNRKEIFNMNRLVVRRNNLRNQCEGVRIQKDVLEQRLKELERQKRQFNQIQNLNLKSTSVELARVWLNNKNEKDNIILLKDQLREKKNLHDEILSQKSKEGERIRRSPDTRFVSLPLPTPSPPLHIPSLNTEETELAKYFRKINLFRKNRPTFVLPNILSRTASRKESCKIPRVMSPIVSKKNHQDTKKNEELDKNSKTLIDITKKTNELETKDCTTQKLDLEEASKTSAFQPVNATVSGEVVEIQLDSDVALSEKSNQIQTTFESYSPTSNSPGKMKLRTSDKRVSPLIVSRMSPSMSHKSPMRGSRIPVPLSSSSPITPSSRIPVRYTPAKAQKRDYEKENCSRRPESVKKIDPSAQLDIEIDTTEVYKKNPAKRCDIGSPKRTVKYPKVDNVNKNVSKNYHENDIPVIIVDQLERPSRRNYHKDENIQSLIEEVSNENNPAIRSHIERNKMFREVQLNKDTWKEKYDDNEKHRKSKDSKKPDFGESFKTDNRHLIKDIGTSDKYIEFMKHYEKFQTQEYRADKDFRDNHKVELGMKVKDAMSRFEKLDESIKKLPDVMEHVPYEYNDTYAPNVEAYSGSERSKSTNDPGIRNRSDSEYSSPHSELSFGSTGSNKYSPPNTASGERAGSMFSWDSSVNQLFGSSTDGANSQAENQNNEFLSGFGFLSNSVTEAHMPIKMF